MNLQADLVAGLTVGVMTVPQALSYARIAGLPSEYGLYGAFMPVLAYAVFGSSRQLVCLLLKQPGSIAWVHTCVCVLSIKERPLIVTHSLKPSRDWLWRFGIAWDCRESKELISECDNIIWCYEGETDL